MALIASMEKAEEIRWLVPDPRRCLECRHRPDTQYEAPPDADRLRATY